MKRYAFPLTIILLLITVVALAAPGDKRPAVTSAAIGLGTSSSPTLASVTATTSVTAPAYNSTAADGYHYVRPYNSIAFAGTPLAGMFVTTPTGPQWYTGSAWEAIGSGGGGTWGSITGTLSAQTDLQAALDAISAGGITMSAGIPANPGAAYLNDTTHVLTVASTTGYTQFTGTHTPWDTTPAAFAFTDLTDVALSTTQTATPVQITGINYPTAVTATGGTAAICTGATVGTCGTFSASPGNIVKDQYVSAQHASSGSNSTAVDTVVTIGGVSDTFTSTTAAAIAPTFSSFSIDTAGTGLTATLSSSTTVGSGGSGGLTLACTTAGTVAATYSSGSPGTSYAYTLSPTVYSGDTCTAAYTQPGNGLEGTTGGVDVATMSGASATNDSESTQGASVCTGADVFCSSWESGSDALNTGATSPEGVFASSSGSVSRITSVAFDGSYSMQEAGNGYVNAIPGSVINDGYYRIAFYVNSEAVGTSTSSELFSLVDSGGNGMAEVEITDDTKNYDNNILFRVKSRVTTASYETVGITYTISTGTWYQAIIHYGKGPSGTIEWWLYNQSGTLLASSTGTAITTSTAAGISRTIVGNGSTSSTISMDAFGWGTSALSALSR